MFVIDDDYGLKKAVDSLIMISVHWQERNKKTAVPPKRLKKNKERIVQTTGQ